jgi:RNA polymerase sigma-70 factor (ECF subfamily)
MSDLPIDRSLHDLLDQRAWLADLAQALVRDPHAAEDAAQQTWLQALLRKPPLREPRAWLATVLGNVMRQRHRGEVRRQRRELAAATRRPDESAVADANERFELQRAVAAAVQALDEPFRTTVLLHHFEGRSLADIARLQQVPTGTVRWRLHRSHQLLRARLADSCGADWRRSLLLLCPAPRSSAMLLLPLLAAGLLVGGLSLWLLSGSGAPAPVAAASAVASLPGIGERDALPGSGGAARAVDRDGVQDPRAGAPVSVVEQRATVRARLVGTDGAPIPDAVLRLFVLKLDRLTAPAELLDVIAPPARSDADGRVRLALRASPELAAQVPLPAARDVVGEVELAASAEGFAEERATLRLAPGDDRDLGTIVLTAVATVRGRALAADGTPCGDASVGVVYPPFPQFCDDLAAQQYAPNTTEKARSEPGGAFAVAGVRTGLAMVWASKPGCISAWRLVDVTAPRTDCADLVLRATAAVADQSWVQELRVRVVGTDGAAVRNARVDYRCETAPGQGQSGMSRTNGEGLVTLQFQLFTPQRIDRVAIAASCDEPPLGPVLVQVTPLAGHEERIELAPARRLRVRAHDEAGAALRTFIVVASAKPPAVGEQSAEASDHVATLLAPAAAATLTVRSEGFAAREVAFDPAATGDELDVPLVRTRGITGTVTADGRPVAGARVSLLHCGKPVLQKNYFSEGERRGLFDAKTDADGRFRVDLEQREPLRLLVRAPGFANAVTARRDFAPDAGWNDVAIELLAGGTLAGTVRGADGAPLPRALVAINDFLGDARTVLADREGRYRCEHLRPGAYEVGLATQAITDDWDSTLGIGAGRNLAAPRADCEVREGETTTFDLGAARSRLRGRLVANGFAPRGWRATLLRNQRWAAERQAVLQADGTFELSTTGVGAHELSLAAPGGPLGNAIVQCTVDLHAGDNEWTVALALAPLRGRAIGASPTAWTGLRQQADGWTITMPVRVDPLTLDFAVDFAPVGEVVLEQGTPAGSVDVARFVVAPR